MFEFVTKELFWAALDEAPLGELAPRNPAHPLDLKHIQDAVAAQLLKGHAGQAIAEVGGGDSRLLPWLSQRNECSNIEPFGGEDGGPTQETKNDGITTIPEYVGIGESSIPDAAFDVVFSISVLEHIDFASLAPFFAETSRILKPSGVTVHLIDLYISDDPSENGPGADRIARYIQTMNDADLVFTEPPRIDEPLRFRSNFASNPDPAMYVWNRLSPTLIEIRKSQQSCSLVAVAKKS